MMPEETITYDSDYREWIDEKFLCPKCGKEIEVEYVNVNWGKRLKLKEK